MAHRSRVLRLNLVGSRPADRERAALIVDRLASRRTVAGDEGQWEVIYETGDTAEAMRLCESDLGEIDPSWFRVLDFIALPSRANLDAEFG